MIRRSRRDAVARKLSARTAQKGHPLRACITVRVLGRRALGRSVPRHYRFSLDLLLGQASERELLRQVYDAVENAYYSDIHVAQRMRVESAMAARGGGSSWVLSSKEAAQ